MEGRIPAQLLTFATYARSRWRDELGAKSVAFPAISTGAFEYPPDAAARIAVDTVRYADTDVERVMLVALDNNTYELYVRLLAIRL